MEKLNSNVAQPDQPRNPIPLSHPWNLDLEQKWSLELAQITKRSYCYENKSHK